MNRRGPESRVKKDGGGGSKSGSASPKTKGRKKSSVADISPETKKIECPAAPASPNKTEESTKATEVAIDLKSNKNVPALESFPAYSVITTNCSNTPVKPAESERNDLHSPSLPVYNPNIFSSTMEADLKITSPENLKRVAKKLPKKRKFDPAEVEKFQDVEESVHNSSSADKLHSLSQVTEVSVNQMDLRDWKGQRVLAKYNNFYLPGVIKEFREGTNIGVTFDKEPSVITFIHDILDKGRYNIVSDHSPSPAQVLVGTSVCVRINPEENVFLEGVVMALSAKPIQYNIKLKSSGSDPDTIWVSRANIRLLLPPWWEELEMSVKDAGDPPPPSEPPPPPPNIPPLSPLVDKSNASAQTTQVWPAQPHPQYKEFQRLDAIYQSAIVPQSQAFHQYPLHTSPTEATRISTMVDMVPSNAPLDLYNAKLNGGKLSELSLTPRRKEDKRSPYYDDESSDDDLKKELKFDSNTQAVVAFNFQRSSLSSQDSLTPCCLGRKSDTASSTPSILSCEQTPSLQSPALGAQKYKKGDIVSGPNGIRKKFNGKQWRRLCSKEGCTKESQRRGYCSRHLALKGKSLRPQSHSYPGRRKGTIKDSLNGKEIEWEDSSRESETSPATLERDRRYSHFDMEETEAANCLVSLGNSPSTTPAFSPNHTPIPVSPHLKSQTLSPLTAAHFTPIGQIQVLHPTVVQSTGGLSWSEAASMQEQALKSPHNLHGIYSTLSNAYHPGVIRTEVIQPRNSSSDIQQENRATVLQVIRSQPSEAATSVIHSSVAVPQPIHPQHFDKLQSEQSLRLMSPTSHLTKHKMLLYPGDPGDMCNGRLRDSPHDLSAKHHSSLATALPTPDPKEDKTASAYFRVLVFHTAFMSVAVIQIRLLVLSLYSRF
ncbi:CIC [Cordylochernes scorpioides]|uniref:CIC n=1 Tax=Cordylochernes scorpioides TaxID=51811 RepID=A0ABY6K5B7_9ARAC|nr:CIC [Cordylochernes scorpioides]